MIYTEIESRPATFGERFAMIVLIWSTLQTMRLNGEKISLKTWLLPIRQYIFKVRPMVSTYLINKEN